MEILPAVLARDANDFKQHILHAGLRAEASMFHVDVLDGSLFNSICWADASVVGTWKNLPDVELHCMVQDPLPVIESWKQNVPTLKRVIVHKEIGRPLQRLITTVRSLELEVTLAVNPGTPVDEASGLAIDSLMIMGVEPGASGQPFLGEPILSKLRRAKALFPNLHLAVDGGISATNILALKTAGADRCAVSSALWKAEKPEEIYKKLLSIGA